jgi:hypothetical protein
LQKNTAPWPKCKNRQLLDLFFFFFTKKWIRVAEAIEESAIFAKN